MHGWYQALREPPALACFRSGASAPPIHRKVSLRGPKIKPQRHAFGDKKSVGCYGKEEGIGGIGKVSCIVGTSTMRRAKNTVAALPG